MVELFYPMASVNTKPRSPFWMMKFTDETGRVVMRSTKQTDRRKAQRIADDMERAAKKARAGELTRGVALKMMGEMMERTTGEVLHVESVKDFFAAWLVSKGTKGAASSTVKRYQPILNGFITFIGPKRASASIGSVTDSEVSRFHDLQLEQGKGPSTADYAVKVLKAAFSTAIKRGLILRNPALSVETMNAGSEERHPFNCEQVKILVKNADEEWKGMVLFGVHTGIRLNDAANLTWDTIDLDTRTVAFTEQKTGRRKRIEKKETLVRLHPDVLWWLKKQPAGIGKAPLFPSLYGKPSGSHGGLSNAFVRLMEKAEIKAPLGQEKKGKGRQFRKLGFHSLRHTLVSRFANEDVPADVRKQVVGHSSDEVHRRYVHLDLAAQDRAVAKLESVIN